MEPRVEGWRVDMLIEQVENDKWSLSAASLKSVSHKLFFMGIGHKMTYN